MDGRDTRWAPGARNRWSLTGELRAGVVACVLRAGPAEPKEPHGGCMVVGEGRGPVDARARTLVALCCGSDAREPSRVLRRKTPATCMDWG
jgi:hypothetical protein